MALMSAALAKKQNPSLEQENLLDLDISLVTTQERPRLLTTSKTYMLTPSRVEIEEAVNAAIIDVHEDCIPENDRMRFRLLTALGHACGHGLEDASACAIRLLNMWSNPKLRPLPNHFMGEQFIADDEIKGKGFLLHELVMEFLTKATNRKQIRRWIRDVKRISQRMRSSIRREKLFGKIINL